MHYDLVIFDLDGTLADTHPVAVGILNFLADEHGLPPVRRSAADALVDRGAGQLLSLLDVSRWKRRLLQHRFQRLMQDQSDVVCPFPGISEAVDHLARQDLKLALVSNHPLDVVRSMLGADMVSAFDHLDTGPSLLDKAQRLGRILRNCRTRPYRAVFIGDRISDALAASRAGVQFGAVAWGSTDIVRLLDAHPDDVFTATHELRRLASVCICANPPLAAA